MQTKIIYVLVSSLEDIYYEQCLVSVYSLRKYHKDAIQRKRLINPYMSYISMNPVFLVD